MHDSFTLWNTYIFHCLCNILMVGNTLIWESKNGASNPRGSIQHGFEHPQCCIAHRAMEAPDVGWTRLGSARTDILGSELISAIAPHLPITLPFSHNLKQDCVCQNAHLQCWRIFSLWSSTASLTQHCLLYANDMDWWALMPQRLSVTAMELPQSADCLVTVPNIMHD